MFCVFSKWSWNFFLDLQFPQMPLWRCNKICFLKSNCDAAMFILLLKEIGIGYKYRINCKGLKKAICSMKLLAG